MKTLVVNSFLLLFLVLFPRELSAQTEIPKDRPHRIMLNLTATPATSMAVTWRTLDQVKDACVEYALATDGTGFKTTTKRVPATSTSWSGHESPDVVWHSVVLNDLAPSTMYVYRVGSPAGWSEWHQFRTADNDPTPFTFTYFGDPQTDLRVHASRMFREAFRSVPASSFWLFAGDLTTTPTDTMWAQWFDATGFINATLPSIMVPGNHDYGSSMIDGKSVANREPPMWRAQFTLPENGVPGMEERSYVVDYQGVRFLMIDSNRRLEDQATWMDSVLTAHRGRWTIVTFHHPLYSTGADRDNRKTRDAFLSVFDKHYVDLVLQGHDHAYGRTHRLAGGKIVKDRDPGTVYVVSSSGPKFYDLNELYRPIMAAMGEKKQLYQVITIDGSKLTFRAVTAAGTLFDSFELSK